jgi:hypothetical protein
MARLLTIVASKCGLGGAVLGAVADLAAAVALDRVAVLAVEFRVSKVAVGAVDAKAHLVVYTQEALVVAVAASAAVATKAAVVELTSRVALVVVNVQIQAVLVGALAILGVKIALWHLGHVVLMQKLTVDALFTQTAKPMFTNDNLVILDMSMRTFRALVKKKD